MRESTLLKVFRKALALTAVCSAGCPCPETYVVAPIRPEQTPPNAFVGPDSRRLSKDECTSLCGASTDECRLVDLCTSGTAADCVRLSSGATDAGVSPQLAVECRLPRACIGGRRPEGFEAHEDCTHDTADFLASLAALEAASVPAFERLATELRQHGAPRALRTRARSAARDEVRHARAVGALARRHGATPKPFTYAKPTTRSLAQLAKENAVEGCVRETFGALLALHQAEHASSPGVRTAFRTIARDEAAHASLAWQVHHWALQRLSADERASVLSALRAEVASLARECDALPNSPAPALGLPSRTMSRQLFASLASDLWS